MHGNIMEVEELWFVNGGETSPISWLIWGLDQWEKALTATQTTMEIMNQEIAAGPLGWNKLEIEGKVCISCSYGTL